jgi:hypothetical protein
MGLKGGEYLEHLELCLPEHQVTEGSRARTLDKCQGIV